VYAEYVVVLTVVALLGAASVAAIGLPLLEHYQLALSLIALPIP